jgi:hypothetical protein
LQTDCKRPLAGTALSPDPVFVPMPVMMKAFAISAGRVVGAVVLIVLLAAACIAGWYARQDHAYAGDLARAMQRADDVSEPEIQERLTTMPTFLCEKRAGMPVAAVLVRVVHWTDEESIAAAKRNAAALEGVDAPGRWKEFHDYARQRRQLQVEWSVATDAANARAVELVSTKKVASDLDVVTLLANDREYRELLAAADGREYEIEKVEKRLSKAAPDHYLNAKAIKRELQRDYGQGTVNLGAMYVNATRPRPKEQQNTTAADAGSAASAGAVAPDPAAMPPTGAVASPVPAAPSPGPAPDPPPTSRERCVNGKTIVARSD